MSKIYIVGDINHEAYLEFSKKLSKLERRGDKTIQIVLSSDGGDGMVGLAFYDRIRLSKDLGHTIRITAIGLVASAAVIILAAGTKGERRMTREAWVMVHDDTPNPHDVKNRRLVEIEKTTAHLRRIENQWNHILAENTKSIESHWDLLHKEETYLSAGECFYLGLIEEII